MKRLLTILGLAIGALAHAEGPVESTVSVSGTSARTSADLQNGWKAMRCTVDVFFRTGSSSATALTTDLPVPASTTRPLYLGNTNERRIAFITSGGTGTCRVYHLDVGPGGIPPNTMTVNGAAISPGSISATGDITTTGSFISNTDGSGINAFSTITSNYWCGNYATCSALFGYDGTNWAFTPGVSAGANNFTTTGRYCTTAACTTNYITNDTFGTMNVVGPMSGSNNISAVGDLACDGYSNPKTGIKNTGTGAACSSNTGAVCVNDAGGLAVADGSGTTVATVSNAGLATVADFKATATTTVGTITLNTGTGTATVRSGAKCVCTDSTANASVQCTVATTTLTATGTGSDVIVYFCGG